MSNNKIDDRLNYIRGIKKIGIMTHTVVGYPNLKDSAELVTTMVESGADFVELQIPFSDPTADGPTILTANHHALENGVNVKYCMKFMEKVSKSVGSPLMFVTYANVPFRYGIDAFCRDAKNAGAEGIIAPDLPIDDDEGFYEACEKYNIYGVPVISQVTTEERIKKIDEAAKKLIYCTARMGVTGSSADFSTDILEYLDKTRKLTSKALAVGFGISKTEHVEKLINHADVAVIGSHIMKLFNSEDSRRFEVVAKFIRSLQIKN